MSGMRIRARAPVPEKPASTAPDPRLPVRLPERETGPAAEPSLEDLARRARSGFNVLRAPVHPPGVTAAPPVQARLKLGNPADRFEREAEDVARRVGPALAGAGSRMSGVEPAGGQGAPLPGALQAPLEEGLGAELGSVRLHTASAADTVARWYRARAVTVDRDVLFRQGEYRPETSAGRELLAHELTHVVQQNPDLAARGSAPVVRQTLGRVAPQCMLLLPDDLRDLSFGYMVGDQESGKLFKVIDVDLPAGQIRVADEQTGEVFDYSIATGVYTSAGVPTGEQNLKRKGSSSGEASPAIRKPALLGQSPGTKRAKADLRSFFNASPSSQPPQAPFSFSPFPGLASAPAPSASGFMVTKAGVAKVISDAWQGKRGSRKLLEEIRDGALAAVRKLEAGSPEVLEVATRLAGLATSYFQNYDQGGPGYKGRATEIEDQAKTVLGQLEALSGIQPVAPPVLPRGIEKIPGPTTKIGRFDVGTAYAVKTGPEGARQGESAFGWAHSEHLNEQYKKEQGITFVAGHLVGEKIGGPFVAENLSPFTTEFNTSGSRDEPEAGMRAPEAEGERRLRAGKVVSYRAAVTYGRDPSNKGDYDFAFSWMEGVDLPLIPKKVDVRVATLKPPENADRTDLDNWTEEMDVKPFAPELVLPPGKEESSQEQ